MSAEGQKSAKHYARMICKYMKDMPDHYADDPQDVQDALGLTDEEFKLGLDWCIERRIIVLESPTAAVAASLDTEDETQSAKPAAASPFTDTEDETEPVKPVVASPFTKEETGETAPVGEPAVAAASGW